MRQYNGVDYDTLYPKTTTDQINGVLPIEKGGTNATTGSGVIRNLANTVNSLILNAEDEILVSAHNGLAGKTTLSALATLVSSIGDGAKIQTGSYVGTGTYGSSNPCSLTFDFVPSVVIIQWNYENEGLADNCFPLVVTNPFSSQTPTYMTNNGIKGVHATFSGKTLTWYNAENGAYQLNYSNSSYNYVAFK